MTRAGYAGDTLEDLLWEALEARAVGFLNLTKSGLHPLPVVVFVDRRPRRLWLAAATESELVRGLGDGGAAIFTAQGPGLMASVGGNLRPDDDPRRLTRLWCAAARAGRVEGPCDAGLRLLRMDCIDAEVSLAEAGLHHFSWDLWAKSLRGRAGVRVSPSHPTLH
jgi:hypothetical protein